MIKKFLILLVGLTVGFSAHAGAVTSTDFSYLFHLYYDNGQLSADRDFQFKYDIVGAAYTQPALTTQFPYRGEILNAAGEVAGHFVFDPKQGDVKFTKGKVSVKAPYVADGEKAIFYDSQNNPVLTIFVSDSSFCNDDGICNADKGEDSLSCPKDCKQTLPAPPSVSPLPTASAGTSSILLGVIYSIVGLVLIVFVIWLLRRKKGPTSLTPPSASLPTPPAPPSPSNPV